MASSLLSCFRPSLYAGILLFAPGAVSLAQWSSSPGTNTPVCVATGDQSGTSIVSDNSGGAIIAWTDARGAHTAIFAQLLDAGGFAHWDTNGNAVCVQNTSQEMVRLITDGSGGAIATWVDYRNGDTALYCQRLGHDGTLKWDEGGIAIASIARTRNYRAISDGKHGLIVAWEDLRNGNLDIFAQRIGPTGLRKWPSGGVPVCTDSGDQTGPEITSAADGGLLCIWTDSRSPGVYLQKLNCAGVPRWHANGIPIASPGSGNPAALPTIAGDGASGAMVVYFSHFSAQPRLVLAERVDSSGSTRWVDTLDSEAGPPQNDIRIAGFGSGPTITTFTIHTQNGFFSFGQVECVDTSGTVLWQKIPFTNQSDILAAAGDGSGGVFLLASIDHTLQNYRFSVQHLNSAGISSWTSTGVDIDTTSAPGGSNMRPANPVIVADNAGGIIASWEQNRTGSLDIFTQHVDMNGALPIQLSSFIASAGPGTQVRVTWKTMSETDCYGFEVQKSKSGSNDFQPIPQSFLPGGGTTISPRTYSFTDAKATPGIWEYRLKQTDRNGAVHYSESVEVHIGGTAAAFALKQNYPNPFNPSTTLKYDLPVNANVRLTVFNSLGQNVATIVDGAVEAGSHSVTFDAHGLASGVYFCRIQAGSYVAVKKMSLIR